MAQDQGTVFYVGDTPYTVMYVGDEIVAFNPIINSLAAKIEYLVVAGGGGSGSDNAGGGGAGGLLSGSFLPTLPLTITTILGDGGTVNNSGKNSKISSSLFISESIGGGKGGGNTLDGFPGGSGGGGGYLGTRAGGLGTIGQGKNGASSSINVFGGGGGGASAAGSTRNGGNGSLWLDGNYYAGGGGGGANSLPVGSAGLGGGGKGGIKFNASYPATAGSPNTGGGGGGDAAGTGGGSGIIIFRYETAAYVSGSITGGDSIITSGSYTYHKFLNVGTSSLTIIE